MTRCSFRSSFWKKPTRNTLALALLAVAIPLGFLTITLLAACLSLFWITRWLYEDAPV